ncbi:MAG: hypothetical protein HFH88_11040 [Lachnospiraceae bacterium]|nr:hypothetical protein [Lachnospiraceae bacterium]
MPEQTKIEPLSATEYDIVEKALWELVKQYPKEHTDPDVTAQYDALGADVSLAVLVDGGRYTKKYVSGSFNAEINFRVAYKSNPRNSPQRINSQAFVGRVMRWLENTKDLPLLTDGRSITKITASGAVPYKDETGQDKSTVYVATAVMEYFKKEGE